MLKIYNTLTKRLEEFKPIDNKNVKMYVCGITPYDSCHIGHGRCYVVFDVIRRYLEYLGYNVTYIQNFTDIDDKIITKSNELKISIHKLTDKYITEFFSLTDTLNIKRATLNPKVTDHIKDIIHAIETLITSNHAYEINGNVYFKVKSFSKYGKFSKKDLNEESPNKTTEKLDKNDFALWKKAKQDEPSWNSPWGKGRPGWHIECSVLATKYLGNTIDIHGGGSDLVFPHHENEIAQSECLTGKLFAKYWIHNGFVTTSNEKMSKSLKNYINLSEILKKYDPNVIRLFFLSQDYKKPLNFSYERLDEAKTRLNKFLELKNKIKNYRLIDKKLDIKMARSAFEALDDDFNTAKAIACLHKLLDHANQTLTNNNFQVNDNVTLTWQTIEKLADILGIVFTIPIDKKLEQKIKKKIKEREIARKNKDFKKADKIRDELLRQGIILEDTQNETIWKKPR